MKTYRIVSCRELCRNAVFAGVALFSSAVLSDVPNSFLWHFNRTSDGLAPASVTDVSGAYPLTLQQYAISGATQYTDQQTVSDGMGTLAFWTPNGAATQTDEDVLGAVQLFRRDNSSGTPGTYVNSRYWLSDSPQTKSLFPVNDSGDIKPFTVEFVFKVSPFDSTELGATAKNFFLGCLDRNMTAAQSYIMNVCAISTGDLYLQCNAKAGNGTLLNKSVVNEADFRDGAWHHLAIVYTLDETKTPHQGSFAVYLDYVQKTTCSCNTVDGKVASLQYARTDTGDTNGFWTVGETASNRQSDLTIDEVRVTQAALEPGELMHVVDKNVQAFFFPLGVSGALSQNFVSDVTLQATDVPQTNFNPVVHLKSAGESVPCAAAALLSGGGTLTVNVQYAMFLGAGAFTLETSFSTSASGTQTLWAQGSTWSVSLVNGALVWTHGSASETVAQGLADGGWHSVALTCATNADAAAYTVFVDGTSHTLSDTVKLGVSVRDLTVGSSFKGRMLGLRYEPSVRAASELLSVQVPAAGDALAYWPLTSSAATGAKVGTTAEGAGNVGLLLTSYVTAASTGATEEHRPAWSNDVPARCIQANGKIVNPDNRSSVYFHNTATFNGQDWVNGSGGGYLGSPALANFGDAFTIEFFAKPSHRYTANMTGYLQVRYDDKRYLLMDAYCGVNDNVKLYLTSDASDPNRHIGYGNGLKVGVWNHVAITVEQAGGEISVTEYSNYQKGKTFTGTAGFDVAKGATLTLGSGNGKEFDGLMDEVRVTCGVLPVSAFMTNFTPRADLTGIWLVDGATGAEHYNNGQLAYLDGTLASGAAESDLLPVSPRTTFRPTGKTRIRATKSVAFDGNGGLTLPCAAIAGADSFTAEATVRGLGTVAAKRRAGGVGWSFGIGTDGRPAMRFDVGDASEGSTADSVSAVAAAAVDANVWHHLALAFDRSTSVATLFADGVAVATAAVSDLVLDGGDLTVGDGLVGNLLGFRFSPQALSPDRFMVAQPKRSGFCVIFR